MAGRATPHILLTLLLLAPCASSASSSALTSEGPAVTTVHGQTTASGNSAGQAVITEHRGITTVVSTENQDTSVTPEVTTASGTSVEPTVPSNLPIITTCGHNIELPVTGLAQTEIHPVIVNFTGEVTANCSWIVRPFNASSNNYFLFFVLDVMPSSCKQNTALSFFDMEPTSGNLSYVNDWCNSTFDMIAGRQGYPTLITFKSQNISELNSTRALFYYGSYIMPERECPDPSMELALRADYNKTELQVSEFPMRLPNGLRCQWKITGPEKGAVNVQLFSSPRPCHNCKPGDNFFLIMDTGRPKMKEPLRVDMTESGIMFNHKSVSGELLLAFHSGDVGGAPDFAITYWADDIDELCPTSTAYLQTQIGEMDVFKGVNHAVGNLTERQCSWRIMTFLFETVVKLVYLSNFDYLANCTFNDFLLIDGHPEPIGMCDSDAFPIWSQYPSTDVQFISQTDSPRREFFIYYTAVPQGTCQGQPVSLTATRQTMTLSESASPGNDTDGTDCRWTINTLAGYEVQGIVPVPPGANWSCSMPWLTVNNGTDPFPEAAPCRSTNTKLVYTSGTNTLYVRFNRKRGVIDDSVRTFTMNYRIHRSSAGATGRAVLPFKIVAVMLIVWSASVV